MKYIDAEKLKEYLDDRYEVCPISDDERHGRHCAIIEIQNFIDSLQQEQPETDGDDGKFVKILVRKEFAELFQKLDDEIQAGQSSFISAMNQQEQPEVDLEKEYKEWWENKVSGNVNIQHTMEWYMHETARHFFELGLNARK